MVTDTAIRVLVVDDHAVVREGIRSVLERQPGFEVVGEAGDGATALKLAQSTTPDVVVLDVSMPGGSGLRTAAELRTHVPEARVLILSMYDNAEYVLEAVRAGASGYLLKDSAATDLRRAVTAVHGGESYYSSAVEAQLSAAKRGEIDRESQAGKLGMLSGREREVLAGIARGLTNKEIGAELGISHRTVETHREGLMRKLRIHTVAGLTKFALDTGLVTG
ncbi:MAG: response regulator transcription factor [Gemmatimonadota bacterium]